MNHRSPSPALRLAPPLLLAVAACTTTRPIVAPETTRSDVIEEIHEAEIPAPYRWLEDTSSAETRAWIEAENEFTRAHLGEVETYGAIEARLRELWNFERWGTPRSAGPRTFFTANAGLGDQDVLYVLDGPKSEPRLLVDPETFLADGAEPGSLALVDWVPSYDGNLMAFALSEKGSEWRTWRFREVAKGRDLDDVLRHTKRESLQWLESNRAVFYSRYDAPAEGTELVARNDPPDVYVHQLGKPQGRDVLVLPRPAAPEVTQEFTLLQNHRIPVITRTELATGHTELFFGTPPEGESLEMGLSPILEGYDARWHFIGDDGATIWLRTDLEAPRGRIVSISLAELAERAAETVLSDPDSELVEEPPPIWTELIPEGPDPIADANVVGGKLIVTYVREQSSFVQVFGIDGTLSGEVELPGPGTVSGFDGGWDDGHTFYSFESFLTPPTVFRLDVGTGESRSVRRPVLAVSPGEFETYRVSFKTVDGRTALSMFVTHRRDLELDGQNAAYLVGDGGFGRSMTPFFDVTNLVWLELGGVLAVPSLRGGGEGGAEWHEAGMGKGRFQTFDDFAAAARWLVRNEYSTPRKMAMGGHGNGGLLAAACLIRFPRLIGAAIVEHGILDLLRFHLFTEGWTWTGEFGDPEHKFQFYDLKMISPLHSIRDIDPIPATLITTADHDDRVPPFYSYKFAAALRAAQPGRAPILLRVMENAGHGAGTPMAKRIAESTDKLAFLSAALGIEHMGGCRCKNVWSH